MASQLTLVHSLCVWPFFCLWSDSCKPQEAEVHLSGCLTLILEHLVLQAY